LLCWLAEQILLPLPGLQLFFFFEVCKLQQAVPLIICFTPVRPYPAWLFVVKFVVRLTRMKQSADSFYLCILFPDFAPVEWGKSTR
jgi:hypothetical protein